MNLSGPATLPRKGGRGRRTVWLVAMAVAVGGFVYAAIRAVEFVRFGLRMQRHVLETAPLEPAALAAWRAEFGDPAAMLSAFPRAGDDARATELAEVSRGLAIEFARLGPRTDALISNVALRNQEPFRSIGKYGDQVLASPHGAIDPPPAVVATFRETQKDRIEKVVALLADGPPPRWEMDEALGPRAPVPNLQAILQLHRVLVAEALIRAQANDADGAARALLACWNLGRSLRDRPEELTQLVAISLGRRHAGLARTLSVPPEEWLDRLAEHDDRASMLKALVMGASGSFEELPKGSSAFERASRADFLNLERKALVRLRDSGIAELPTRKEMENPEPEPEALSAGAILASIVLPNRTHSWNQVDRLIVETEMTEKVLQLKKLRADLGRWPSPVAGIESSRAFAGRWIYSVNENGRMSLAFSDEPVWVVQYGLRIPLRYESD